jgi:hypothetical protein
MSYAPRHSSLSGAAGVRFPLYWKPESMVKIYADRTAFTFQLHVNDWIPPVPHRQGDALSSRIVSPNEEDALAR